MATLEVIYSELSLRKVYFHTQEGGRKMKRLDADFAPPRSLYSDLPERFCFTRTRVPPRAFKKDRRVREWGVEWYALTMV